MKVVIIAGGKGTRIASVNSEVPKPMIPIAGKPVVEYQVELARRYGYHEIIFVVGYLADQIENYFGDGAKWGVKIEYFHEKSPLGTSGAIPLITQKLTDDFWVFYGDTIMDFDMHAMLAFHKKTEPYATLFLHPNDHPYDSDLVELTPTNQVTAFYPKPHPENTNFHNQVNAALYIVNKKAIPYIPTDAKSDFGKDIFPTLLAQGKKVSGYTSPEYIKDMGTPQRWESVGNDIITGKVSRLNLRNKRPAIFLDRDGVICQEVNLLTKPEQVQLIEGAAQAIKMINHAGYLAVLVTNQPVIARNLCTTEELDNIHKKLETLLGHQHAYLDKIYFCPHHPHSGYPEERKEYKIECQCRKPNPGMLLSATDDLNIDLENSYMIGDNDRDTQAGQAAHVKQSIKIEQNKSNALLDTIKQILT